MRNKILVVIMILYGPISFAQWTVVSVTNNAENTYSGDVVIKSTSHLRLYRQLISHLPKSDTKLGGEFVGSNGWWGFRTSTDNSFHLDIDGNSAPKSAFTINQSGYVGIGSTTPSSQLHLASNENHALTISRLNGQYGFRIFREAAGGNVNFQIGTGASTWETKIKIGEGEDAKTILLFNPDGGNVGIGTSQPDAPLDVFTNTPTVPDYVFEKNYDLRTLAEVEAYINQNKHLPEIPAAKEMEQNGVNLGEMNMMLLKKVEELTLYVIEQQKEIKELKKEMEQMKNAQK